ncbi:hypothetical protein NUW58_g10217 [Xylaria curta]|uniref:Uncharacterized protein n=1 Tax=Xylaria curta TaxID=42375 RepID=A0ACC1MN67_9PEZI|nr:hypothetical protein NUW58_g10217 [Xylaria curta]
MASPEISRLLAEAKAADDQAAAYDSLLANLKSHSMPTTVAADMKAIADSLFSNDLRVVALRNVLERFISVLRDFENADLSVEELKNQLNRDINALSPVRDQTTGIFGLITHTDSEGRRFSPAHYVRKALADDPDLPLFVELNSTFTEIVWDPLSSGGLPAVMAINYVAGPSAYKADPRYDPNRNASSKFTYIGKELIIAGGAFNSPQILKLSGIGPADELKKHNITVVVDLPGVGANLGDIYEGSVVSLANKPNIDNMGSYSVQLKTSVSEGGRDIALW